MRRRLYLLLLLLCRHGTSALKHSLKFFLTETSGIQKLPEFVGVVMVDDVQAGYCDSNSRTAEPRQDWARKLVKEEPQHQKWYSQKCFERHRVFRDTMDTLKQLLNQTGGVHVLQKVEGCEWDDETGQVTGFSQYGYDGQDFISLDLKNLTWIALIPEAVIIKQMWETDRSRLEYYKNFYTFICPDWIRRYVDYGRSFLQRKDLPSVSLLQKTSSSPVRCFATGFYPKTASLFWRRDGVEIHEDVEPGEILPNQDGTFQMSVDLNVSSVKAEGWGRLDCVFQLSGVKEDMVTRLEKDQIRTNWVPESSYAAVIGVVVGLLILLVVIVGLIAWRRNWFRSVNQYLRVLVRNSNGPSTEQSAESRV